MAADVPVAQVFHTDGVAGHGAAHIIALTQYLEFRIKVFELGFPLLGNGVFEKVHGILDNPLARRFEDALRWTPPV